MNERSAERSLSADAAPAQAPAGQTDRRRFLRRVAAGTSGAVALGLGWPAAAAARRAC